MRDMSGMKIKTLAPIHMAVVHTMHKEYPNLQEPHITMEVIGDYFASKLSFFLMGETETETTNQRPLKIPYSWWDHTLERFPILQLIGGQPRYKEIVVQTHSTTYTVYPDIPGPHHPRKKIHIEEDFLR